MPAAAGIAGLVAVRLAGTRWHRANRWEAAVGRAGHRYVFLDSPFGTSLDVLISAAVPVATAAVGVWLLLRWRAGDRRLAGAGLGAILGAVVTAELLKLTLASRSGVPHWFDQGYPSGHTATTCTTAFVLLLLAPGRRWALVAAAAFTTLIAAGVALDGWHLPSDVLGAFLLSGTWCFALVALLDVPRPPLPSPGDAALAVLSAAVVVAVLLVHAGIPTDAPVTHVQRETVAALGAAALASVLAAAALLGVRR